MRIAYFTDTFMPEVNGLTNTLSHLGAFLEDRHIQHAVFAPAYDTAKDDIHSEYRQVYRFKGFNSKLSPESRLAFPPFWEIDKICDNFQPDIVHITTELGIGFRGMRYALSHELPLVMSYHTDYCKYLNYFNLDFLRPLLETYLAWFYGFSCRTLVPSRNTLEELFRKQYNNLGIWSRGIDTERFNPQFRSEKLREKFGKAKFIFLYVGRLSPEKNLDMLLYAIEKIESRFPGKAAFVFSGDGPHADLIRQRNLSNVFLTGFLRGVELSSVYASADCFAFPSATETFGNAALEAMASGLPVAAVASGGVTDFLSHGHNALLCADGDADAYAENLAAIMENAALRRHLSENARASALSRNWNHIFDGLMNVYDNAIKEQWQMYLKNAS